MIRNLFLQFTLHGTVVMEYLIGFDGAHGIYDERKRKKKSLDFVDVRKVSRGQ